MLVAVGDLYSKTISEFAIGLYFNALKEYDLPAVRQAFDRCVKNPDSGQFMPKPADLINMITGSSLDQSHAAWVKVDKAIRQVGTYASVVFDDPLIHKVVTDMGGWVTMGNKQEDEWPHVQRHFQNQYKGFCLRGERPEYEPILVGLADATNAPHGFKSRSVPVLIGDQEKAAQVMNSGTTGSLKIGRLTEQMRIAQS